MFEVSPDEFLEGGIHRREYRDIVQHVFWEG
jgi:hypothetical protein